MNGLDAVSVNIILGYLPNFFVALKLTVADRKLRLLTRSQVRSFIGAYVLSTDAAYDLAAAHRASASALSVVVPSLHGIESRWGSLPIPHADIEVSSSGDEGHGAQEGAACVILPIDTSNLQAQRPNTYRLPGGVFVAELENGCNVVWNGRPLHCWCRPMLLPTDMRRDLESCRPIFGQCRYVLGRFTLTV